VLLQNSPTSSHRLGHGRTNWQNRCEIKQAIRLDAKTSMRLGHGSLDPTTMPMPMQSPAKVVPACWDDQFHAWAAYRNQTLNQSTTLISKLQAIVAILQRKNLEHPVNRPTIGQLQAWGVKTTKSAMAAPQCATLPAGRANVPPEPCTIQAVPLDSYLPQSRNFNTKSWDVKMLKHRVENWQIYDITRWYVG
jgi:hypothetical protein